MVPVVRSESFDGSSRPSSWVSVLSVPTDGHIVEAGRVTHDGRPGGSKPDDWGGPMIRRSFVIGDVLYTLSSVGILASDLQSLSDRSWLAF